MKLKNLSSKWILMISALALFSAHQTRRIGVDMPDYSRNPAMSGPARVVPVRHRRSHSHHAEKIRTQSFKTES